MTTASTRPLPGSLGELASRNAAPPSSSSEPCKIEAKQLNFYYGQKRALEDITVQIRPHLVTAFIGPSGCGKSTFLRTINRMNDLIEGVKITGQVVIDDVDVWETAGNCSETR